MDTFFLLCAIIGGTIMLLQFAMTMLGVGGHHGDGGDYGGSDYGSGSLDIGHDASVGGGDFSSGHGHGVATDHLSGHDQASGHDQVPHHHQQHDGLWLFKVITFQTLVAAVAFFGIAGKAAVASGLQPLQALLIAAAVGFAAMHAVYYLVRSLHKFNADGTVQVGRAVGLPGTVYLTIPEANAGAGKIHLNLQNRIVELQAMTSQERLPSGARIRVVGMLGPDTVAVERLIESETTSHV